jgi:hypothetical protein
MGKRTAMAMVLAAAGCASADVAFNSFSAGDTYSGNGFLVYGPSASVQVAHAFQFVAGAGGGLTRLVVPIQHQQGSPNAYTFEVYSDAGNIPGISLGAIGQAAGLVYSTLPAPPPVSIQADGHIALFAGATYWVVARTTGNAQGTWHGNAHNQQGLRAYQTGGGGGWTTGAVTTAAFRVEVTHGLCYANCDASTVAPILNVQDFGCFLTRFSSGDSYANCDGSTTPPVLNVQDFGCFLTRFSAGCP